MFTCFLWFSRDFPCYPSIYHFVQVLFLFIILPLCQMLTWHPPEYPMLTYAHQGLSYFCAHRKICWQACCCFSAIQIFPQSLISKLQKDSPKDKARPKCGPSSGTLGPIQIIFTRVHLLYWAGSVFKSQLPSTKTLWVVAFLRTFFASIL